MNASQKKIKTIVLKADQGLLRALCGQKVLLEPEARLRAFASKG